MFCYFFGLTIKEIIVAEIRRSSLYEDDCFEIAEQ